MKPECCGTGTPPGRAGCGSRPSPGSTAHMERSTFAPTTSSSSLSTDGLRGTESFCNALRARLVGVPRERAGIVLIDAHEVAQVASFRSNELGEPREDVIGLAAIARL